MVLRNRRLGNVCLYATLSTLAMLAFTGCPHEEETVSVPDGAGMTQAGAIAAITDAGLVVRTITQACSATADAGIVIRQKPPADTDVSPGTRVDLTISSGVACGEGEGEGETAGATETVLLPGNVPLEMAWCPAGTFEMGSAVTELDRYDNEDQHKVTLSSGFWMGKHELTKEQWYAVMGTTPWSGQQYVLDDETSPAIYITWEDVQTFIAALNTYTDLAFRTPTEAEWEYACRADTTTRFYWGDDEDYTAIGDYAWYYTNAYSTGHAHDVGGKLPNAWGLYDMSGNVWEWCQDWYSSNLGTADATDPTGPESGSYRVLRGGSYVRIASRCRSASRNYDYPIANYYYYSAFGVRIARTP